MALWMLMCRLAWIAALMLVSAGCGRSTAYRPPGLQAGTPSDGGAAGGPSFPVTGINSGTLTVTAVEPGSGPFSGGTTAVVRGSGFDDNTVVRIGGIAIQPGDVVRDGRNRITIVVPAGQVGPADVTITQGGTTVTLRDGFMYNALAITPNQGSSAGGALVDLFVSGATLSEDSVVEFDGQPCTELRLASPQRATCKTPPHAAGVVDVIARRPQPTDSPALIAPKSYEFTETIDAVSGGLSGGPIAGTLNITVVDYGNAKVIPKALVVVGNDPKTALHAFTDARGAITFSTADLEGPVTVHASAKCFERGSIVSFDAKNVTLFLNPIADLTCAGEGDPGAGPRQLVATVSGQLIFPGAKEFAVNSWDIVPKPKANEIRVAYVFTTRSSVDARNPAPDAAGVELARLVEDTAVVGDRGYQYRIVARPAGLAVYALCGLERLDTQKFTPYVMGVAHNVVTSPGDETRDVDLLMTITLDRELAVGLSGLPAPAAEGPNEFRVRAYADLGGEGLIVREIGDVSPDVLIRRSGAELFRFVGQPAFVGGLANATYYIQAGFYTAKSDLPYTSQKRTGVAQSGSPLVLAEFLNIPQLVAPANGALIPEDRLLRFSLAGPMPDLIMVSIVGGDGLPAWTEILPGDAREVPLPDLSLIDGQVDVAAGFLQWTVTAVKVNDFRYNEFQYTYAQSRYWTHTARAAFFARR
jgi:hypothetical protein